MAMYGQEDGKRVEDQSQGRAFIIALANPRMLHARLPGSIIDRCQHCDSVFRRKAGYGTLANARHWIAAFIFPAAGEDMSNSRGIHVLKDVLWYR
jgi:hypothetical protein